ncbi:MAG TPA: zinc-binding dehydrogenase [Myxococcaceae bacterium]|jgi:NADPH:quinone reductase-like Zn-dependent oxidoreductase
MVPLRCTGRNRRGPRAFGAETRGTHSLAPLSFKSGTYSGVFTLLPLLSGVGREHHGEILERIAALVEEEGKLSPRLDSRTFGLADAEAAHAAVSSGSAAGKIVVTVA